MNGLALLALFFLASKAKTSTSSSPQLKGPRRKVKGESGSTWYVANSTGFFGADSTELQIFSVFASETGNELVISYVQFPEVSMYFGDGGKPITVKDKRARALFYAAPSTLTKTAISDFCESDNFLQ